MDDQEQIQLEKAIHRELRGLPELKAPETLLHRVMLSVHERERARWRRSWMNWPFGLQAGSLIVLLFSAGLVSYLAGAAWDGVNAASMWQRAVMSLAWLQPFWEILVAISNTILVVLRAANQNLILIGAGALVLAYLMCVGLGTVCVRIAVKPGRGV